MSEKFDVNKYPPGHEFTVVQCEYCGAFYEPCGKEHRCRKKQKSESEKLIKIGEEASKGFADGIKDDELRAKQIEDMDTILRRIFGSPFAYKIDYGKYGGFEGHKEVYTKDIAKELTAKGYRKADVLAREIFEELENVIVGNQYGEAKILISEFLKLKKKYTEGEG